MSISNAELQSIWNARVTREYREREHNESRRKSELDVINIASALSKGLRVTMAASPDLFMRYDFSVDEAARLLAGWITQQPQRPSSV